MKTLLYSPLNIKQWNDFIKSSKNGTFMLERNYMDYHSDRFTDHSLMFFDESDKLVAVMPASLHESELRSHGGLTYGGVVSDKKMTAQKMLEIFNLIKIHMKEKNINKLIYKRVPSIYYSYPSDEDLYALFINDAKLIRRDISTTIDLKDPIKFNERRRRNIKKAIKTSLYIKTSTDFESYIVLLNNILREHHKVKAVHSVEELTQLQKLFPNNIKLFSAYLENKMVAGSVVFETDTVAHTQYLVNDNVGREVGALDFVIEYIIKTYSSQKKYLDFGISTENNGRYLNIGLISQKQEFGGRAIVYDSYELKV